MSIPLNSMALLSYQSVSKALKPHEIKARFLFILEMKGGENTPRWTVGGHKSKVYPTHLPIAELKEINSFEHADVDVPPGWSKLHHFIYLLGTGRDEHGWEYRSKWSDGKPAETEEQWRGYYQVNDVQRRVWMSVAVSSADLARAKEVVAAYLTSQLVENRRLLREDIRRKEPGFLVGTAWKSRYLVLSEDKIQVFPHARAAQDEATRIATTRASPATNVPQVEKPFDMNANEIPLRFVSFQRMYGPQGGTKSDYMCSLQDRRSDNIACILDFENEDKWKKWMIALRYAIAVNSPNLDFSPFDYGPPCDDLAPSRVLVFGHLEKLGHFRTNWRKRFFNLTSFELIYYKNEDVMGRLALDGARLLFQDRTDEETSCTFGIATPSEQTLVMRAISVKKRRFWEDYIKNQIDLLAHVNRKYGFRQNKAKKILERKASEKLLQQEESATEGEAQAQVKAESAPTTEAAEEEHVGRPSIPHIINVVEQDEEGEEGEEGEGGGMEAPPSYESHAPMRLSNIYIPPPEDGEGNADIDTNVEVIPSLRKRSSVIAEDQTEDEEEEGEDDGIQCVPE